MKKMNWVLLFFTTTVFMVSCDSGGKNKTEEKITEIKATSTSAEATASFQQGLLSLDLGEVQKARVAFSKAIEQDPKFGWAYLMRANTAPSTKEFADDITKGKANSDSAENWQKWYADYLSTNLAGNRDKGLEILQQIAEAYPAAARAQVDLGNGYAGNNQFNKARECYHNAITLDPKWVGGYAALTNSFLFNEPKDLKKAEENAGQLVALAPTSAGAQITLGDCYRAQNDFKKARDAYAKAVTLAPDASEAYYKEGHANTYLGNLEEARKNYDDGGKHDISLLPALLNITYTYLYAGDAKAAMKNVMDGIAKLDSSKPAGTYAVEKIACFNTAASIAIHMGDAEAMKELVTKMLPLTAQVNNEIKTPESKIFMIADSLKWKAITAMLDGKYDVAKAKAEEMKSAVAEIKDDRKLEGYHYLMGLISMKQKNYADAITHFQQGDPNSIYIKYMLAKANEAQGNKDKAIALYKEVAVFNFNGIENALVRNEVKKKLATP